MELIILVYCANVGVAGWIGITSLWFPDLASTTVFGGAYQTSELTRLVGCLWLAIAVLSVLGVFHPVVWAPVLFLQLIYKATWLFVVGLRSWKRKVAIPAGMAVFFVVWVVVLPFVIPWRSWFV